MTVLEIVLTIIVGLLGLVVIYFIALFIMKRNNPAPVDTKILEQQLKFLKDQVKDQSSLINSFKDNWNVHDRNNNEKITKLITSLELFQGSLYKKEDDYKRNADVIKGQVTNVIKDLASLKESSTTLNKISDNIQTLQEVFINTKKRGNVGEYALEKILTNILGKNKKLWEREYQMPDGKRIDAYIKPEATREGIAIDAKFPKDNYKKYFETENEKHREAYLKSFRIDIRNRINEVAKYISPKNNISSAIMFVPSEEIFSFIYAYLQEDAVDYAVGKKVWITSPTTLAAVLFTVDKNIKDIQFNRNVGKIRDNLIKIKVDFDRWIERWEKVKKDFDTTNKGINELDKTHHKLANNYSNILEMPEENQESE